MREELLYENRRRLAERVSSLYGRIPEVFAPGTDRFSENLDAFHRIFSAEEKECRVALWNKLTFRELLLGDLDKELFSTEEIEFLQKHDRAMDDSIDRSVNYNDAIKTERLVLTSESDPVWVSDHSLMLNDYRVHLKRDGDFETFTSYKLTRVNLRRFRIRNPFYFLVLEKVSRNMVGLVALEEYDEDRHMATIAWYVFKPYRQKGYGEEAVSALIDRAFQGKLFEAREQLMKYTYRRHFAKIDLIRAYIRVTNTPSRELARAVGFSEKYVDGRHFFTEGKGCEDGVVYEICK